MFPGTRLDISRCSQGYRMQIASAPISHLTPRARAAAHVALRGVLSRCRAPASCILTSGNRKKRNAAEIHSPSSPVVYIQNHRQNTKVTARTASINSAVLWRREQALSPMSICGRYIYSGAETILANGFTSI
jgi:hypothetical protein